MIRVRSQHPRGQAPARRLRRSAARFLRALGREGAELSVLLVGDAAIRRINREWRAVDRPTDVLSFPAAALPGDGARWLGDVVVSLDTARRRARQDGRPLAAELDRYLAHGLLHLLGLDHERPRQAREMARREEELLGEEGMIGRLPLTPERSPSRSRTLPVSRAEPSTPAPAGAEAREEQVSRSRSKAQAQSRSRPKSP